MYLNALIVHNAIKKVKAVVQVIGSHTLPAVPKGEDELKDWYAKVIPTHASRDL